MNHGADGIRINPGNISAEGIREIVRMAKDNGKVIRIGINAGSLEKEICSPAMAVRRPRPSSRAP